MEIGLGRGADKPVLATLKAALKDRQEIVRVEAVKALTALGGKATATILSQALYKSPDPVVRQMAAEALGHPDRTRLI